MQRRVKRKAEVKIGVVAQLGEHLPCTQGVRSSILLGSTNTWVFIGFIQIKVFLRKDILI